MRARQRVFLAALVAAVSFSMSVTPARSHVAPVTEAISCPSGTAWDNLLQRCV